jgi:AcrR family transcriptional regulator
MAATPTSARRLTPKGEATRARIIELAAEVFATEGYANASIRDLASRSGLSSGAIATDEDSLPNAVVQLTLPEIDAYQYEHAAKRDQIRSLLLEAAVAVRTDPDVRDRLREAVTPHIDRATAAHEEWRDRAGVDAALDMRSLVLLLWSADLGLAVLDAIGIDRPDGSTWSELMRRLLQGLEAPDANPGPPTPRPTRRTKRR